MTGQERTLPERGSLPSTLGGSQVRVGPYCDLGGDVGFVVSRETSGKYEGIAVHLTPDDAERMAHALLRSAADGRARKEATR